MKMLMLAVLLSACGKKDPPESAAEAVAEAAPTPEPAPAPEPPPPPPGPVSNVNLNVTFTYADGSSKSGNVVRVERGDDFFAENGWLDDESKIKVSAEGASEYKKLPWSEIKSVTIKSGSIPGDVSCSYSSSYMPWMYECALKNRPTLTDSSGKQWAADTGHKWRFTFADDSEVEFWLKKHYTRIQDDTEPSLDTEMMERPELYVTLNKQLAQEARNSMVVSIRIE